MDAYDRKARLYPAICVLFPLTFLAATLFEVGSWWTSLSGLVAVGGVHVLIIQLVRDRGADVQEKLWQAWGGNPTSTLLKWDGNDEAVVRRLHDNLNRALPEPLPTRADEIAEPGIAMGQYDRAVQFLRDHTRDGARFPILRAELGNYGFRRNLYGLRPIGVVASAGAAVISVVFIGIGFDGHYLRWTFPLVIAVCALLLWVRFVNSAFVRRDARRYATALLNAGEQLHH